MGKKTDYIFTAIIALLGIVHISLTPVFYKSINDDASIFIGMGLAFVFLGALNISRLLSDKRNVTILCTICNILGIGYLVFFSITLRKIEPQVLISVFAVLVPTVQALINLTKAKSINC